jgi:nucleotide-binding universal stress UspA family protein/glycosyltransferase involved in cell wall biosynthesis
MRKPHASVVFRKILVPVILGCETGSALTAAQYIGENESILLVGLVGVNEGESLSTGALPARQMREKLRALANTDGIRVRSRVLVSHHLWVELVTVIAEEQPDLLILEWPGCFEALNTNPSEVLLHPPCDIALIRGHIQVVAPKILLPIRGGPYAELALRLSLSIAGNKNAKITSLHLIPPKSGPQQDAPFKGLSKVLVNLPEVKHHNMHTDQPLETILSQSNDSDLVILGASVRPPDSPLALGPVTEGVLRGSPAAVIAVKTRRSMPDDFQSEVSGQTAISVLVDKWFAENTFHADEFSHVERLLSVKSEQRVTISLALPALNEEETVGNVINIIKTELMDRLPLLDEIVLIDSDSTDRTREIARNLEVPVFIHQQILPQYGARCGKGEALWKSLFLTKGDIVIWIDTDIVNIHPRFVFGLIGPLLLNPQIQFVKGFYRRPLKVGDKIQAGGGGRVTELTARPLLNLFYPELSGIVQPLSGEYGGRREILEKLPFFSGYGVEIGLLIDVFERYGLSAIAQIDLQERIHHNQPLESLSKMSFAIIQSVIRKLELRYGRGILEDVNRTMKLIRYEPGHFFLDIEEIAEQERPPMADLPEYRPAKVER